MAEFVIPCRSTLQRHPIQRFILRFYLLDHLSPRKKTVAALASSLACCTLTAIHGAPGTGKTQLAALLAKSLGACRAWLRFRNLNPEEAAGQLDAACELLRPGFKTAERAGYYADLCKQLQPDALLVVDDLPRLSAEDAFSQRLILLARACAAHGVRILTTSLHPMPLTLKSPSGTSVAHELEALPRDDTEATEILESYGAPAEFLTAKRVSLVNTIASHNPLLLNAAARYLAKYSWAFRVDEFGALVGQKHTDEIRQEVVPRLLQQVQDEQSRGLLYRLDLVVGPFGIEEVNALASVPPEVQHPEEHLDSLMGLCIQRDARDQFTVSPVFENIAHSNLPSNRMKACQWVLGRRILAKRRINQFDASHAVIYILAAGDVNQAGALLGMALTGFHRRGIPEDDCGLLSIWSAMPLSDQMDLGLRIHIRSTMALR